MKKIIVNCETGEIVERELNEEELAQYEADKLAAELKASNEAAEITARQSILDRLGLTEEEARLLLG